MYANFGLDGEVKTILEIARLHPELSPRLLAVKITEEEFSVSESTICRILKQNGIIAPNLLPEMLADIPMGYSMPFGTPYHHQRRAKIERLTRRIRSRTEAIVSLG